MNYLSIVTTLLKSGADPHQSDDQVFIKFGYPKIYQRKYHTSTKRGERKEDFFLTPCFANSFNTYNDFEKNIIKKGEKLMELFDKYFPPKQFSAKWLLRENTN